MLPGGVSKKKRRASKRKGTKKRFDWADLGRMVNFFNSLGKKKRVFFKKKKSKKRVAWDDLEWYIKVAVIMGWIYLLTFLVAIISVIGVDTISSWFAAVFSWFKSFFLWIGSLFSSLFSWLGSVFSSIISWFKFVFS